jgi:hypothetical protein
MLKTAFRGKCGTARDLRSCRLRTPPPVWHRVQTLPRHSFLSRRGSPEIEKHKYRRRFRLAFAAGKMALICAWSHAKDLSERPGHMGMAEVSASRGNVDERNRLLPDQLLGPLQP